MRSIRSLRCLLASLALATCAENNKTSVFSSIGRGIQKEAAAVKQPIDETIATIGSSQCSNVKKLIGVTYDQIEGEKEPDLNSLTLEYRDQSIRKVFNITSAGRTIPEERGFNPHQDLIIFLHGFTDDPSKGSFSNISDAFLRRGACNILALDASSLIQWLYLRSSTYVRFIGEKLGEVLASMVHSGVKPSQIHLIGHSLGSHIAGFTGKQFTTLTGFKVGRISGLDPAGPCFSHIDPDCKLNATDADFVDVMHTDAGVYGLKDVVGQVDYFPNSGSQQPNCFFQTCSHSRAWIYYAESVLNPQAFPAKQCRDWEAFKKDECQDRDVAYMGYPAKPGTKGQFYLQTGGDEPYGRGKEGLKFENNEGFLRNVASSIFG